MKFIYLSYYLQKSSNMLRWVFLTYYYDKWSVHYITVYGYIILFLYNYNIIPIYYYKDHATRDNTRENYLSYTHTK